MPSCFCRLHGSLIASCLEACLCALAATCLEQLDAEVACGVLQLLELLDSNKDFEQLRSVCMDHMMEVCTIQAIATNQQVQEQFCALPFAIVRTWAKKTANAGHMWFQGPEAQDDVVVMLSMWMHGFQGLAASAEQRAKLFKSIQLSALSAWFLLAVVPRLPWSSTPPAGKQPRKVAEEMLRRHMALEAHNQQLEDENRRRRPARMSTPCGGHEDRSPKCVVSVPRAELSAAIQQTLANRRSSDPVAGGSVFICGVVWEAVWKLEFVDNYTGDLDSDADIDEVDGPSSTDSDGDNVDGGDDGGDTDSEGGSVDGGDDKSSTPAVECCTLGLFLRASQTQLLRGLDWADVPGILVTSSNFGVIGTHLSACSQRTKHNKWTRIGPAAARKMIGFKDLLSQPLTSIKDVEAFMSSDDNMHLAIKVSCA